MLKMLKISVVGHQRQGVRSGKGTEIRGCEGGTAKGTGITHFQILVFESCLKTDSF